MTRRIEKFFLATVFFLVLVLAMSPGNALAFNENFESGTEGWTTEGTWSLITTDHHGGANCMTDSPEGKYQDNEDSALISPSIELSTATPLILSFWQHYSFYLSGDYSSDWGYVQISTDGGVTWANLASYYGTVSNWQQKNIDLSAYAGQTVKIRFLLVSQLGGESDGWYIDDISVDGTELPSGPQPSYKEGFESGAVNWTTEGTWSLITTDHHGGANCMTDSPEGNYQDNEDSALISPSIELSTATPLILSFWQHYSFYLSGDYSSDWGYVQISTDGGVTWANLASYYGTVSNWQQKNIDLSAYAGQTVKIRFLLVSQLGGESDGWYIDDISVDGTELPPGPLPNYQEGFESGAEGWTTEGTWSLITTDHRGGSNCMTDSPEGNYQDNESSALISPSIELSAATPLILSFWQHYSFYLSGDYSSDWGYIQISTDGGVTWATLASYYGTVSNWQQKNIDLSAYAGQTVKIRFLLVSQLGGESDGWYIDDIATETLNINDNCPNDPNKVEPGACGCGIADTDSDGDGTPDCNDNCPNTPLGETADSNGCSASQRDSDGDGVKDNVDNCPDSADGEAVDASGCSVSQPDTDGDGIKDNVDNCPNTPDSEPVDASGCSASQKGYVMSTFGDVPGDNAPGVFLSAQNMNDNGNGTYQILYDSGGGSLESGSFTYSVSPHRILSVTVNGNFYHGVMTEDRGIFTIAETTGGTGIDMAIEKSSGMSNAGLTGDYVMSEFDDSISNNDPHASLSLINLDGSGNGTYQQLYVSDNSSLESGSVTYSVESDGSLNLGGHHGIVSSDGSVFTATNTIDSYPGIYVGIKKSSGMSNDSLKGDFIMSNFDDEEETNAPWAGLSAVRMDGNGNLTFEEIYHSGNGALESGSCSYSVSPDGMFTVTHDGVVDHGIVNADGGIFTIADTTGDGSGILIGIKNNDFICPSVCQKLNAAGKLFVDLAGYRTKEIKNTVKFDEDSSRNKAITKFYAGWKKAEDMATKKSLDCPTETKETVQGLIEDALEDVYAKVSEDAKPSGKDANKMVGDLLKATGIMCSAILNAESTNIKKLNTLKLDAAWTKAKAKFESSWSKAVEKAEEKGVSGLTDADMHDVEDIMDNLVIAVSGMGL